MSIGSTNALQKSNGNCLLNSLVDPDTGKLINFNTTYTINNQEPDEDGNFNLTPEILNAASAIHNHNINDINNLHAILDEKSNLDHSHNVVTSINVNDTVLTGNVKIEGKGNINVSKNMNNINISVTPFIADIANEIEDSNNIEEPFNIFIGTEVEYEEFKNTMIEGKRYLGLIRS